MVTLPEMLPPDQTMDPVPPMVAVPSRLPGWIIARLVPALILMVPDTLTGDATSNRPPPLIEVPAREAGAPTSCSCLPLAMVMLAVPSLVSETRSSTTAACVEEVSTTSLPWLRISSGLTQQDPALNRLPGARLRTPSGALTSLACSAPWYPEPSANVMVPWLITDAMTGCAASV